MKRLLLSIVVGFVLVTAYMMVAAVMLVVSGYKIELVPYLDLPMRLPKVVFFYLFPPTAEDFSQHMNQKQLVLAILAYLANVLLYSIPAYIFITLSSRWRRKVALPQMEPPPPPSFVN